MPVAQAIGERRMRPEGSSSAINSATVGGLPAHATLEGRSSRGRGAAAYRHAEQWTSVCVEVAGGRERARRPRVRPMHCPYTASGTGLSVSSGRASTMNACANEGMSLKYVVFWPPAGGPGRFSATTSNLWRSELIEEGKVRRSSSHIVDLPRVSTLFFFLLLLVR